MYKPSSVSNAPALGVCQKPVIYLTHISLTPIICELAQEVNPLKFQTQAQVAHANKSEIAQLESALAPGKFYCLDAGYGEYRFLDKIIQQPSSFVMRLRDNASYETIEERTLSEADRKVGIEFDRVVWLGRKQTRDNLSQTC